MTPRLVRALVVSVLASSGGLALLVVFGPDVSWARIRGLTPAPIAAAIASLAVWFVLAALRLVVLSADLGVRLRFRAAARAHTVGLFGTMVTPGGSGGAPATALVLGQQGLTVEAGWVVAIAVLAADTLFYGWSLPLGLVVLVQRGLLPASSSWIPLGVLGATLAAVLAFVLIFRVHWLDGLADRLFRGPLLRFRRRSLRAIRGFTNTSDSFPYRNPVWHLKIQGLTAASWIGFFMALPLIASAYGARFDPVGGTTFLLVATALSAVVPTPGASGFFEVGVGAYLVRLDADAPATVITIVWRLITFYVFFLIGPLVGGYVLAAGDRSPTGAIGEIDKADPRERTDGAVSESTPPSRSS